MGFGLPSLERLYNAPVTDYHVNALEEGLRRIRRHPFAAAVLDKVSASVAVVADRLQRPALGELPAFSQSRNPDLPQEMERRWRWL